MLKIKRLSREILCSILGHKYSNHITQPNNIEIDWCDRCGVYRSFEKDKKVLRAFD